MGRYTSDDNRSMQLNDNNDRYYSSRGIDRDELDYDFEEDDDNTQGDNMSFFKIDNKLVRKSTITFIEPRYELKFEEKTITCHVRDRYGDGKNKKKDIITVTPKVSLTIHTNFGKTFTKELDKRFGIFNSSSSNCRYVYDLEAIRSYDYRIFDLAEKSSDDDPLRWHMKSDLFDFTTCFEAKTFDEKVLTDYMDKCFFKYANECMTRLLDNVNKIE